MKSKWSLDKIGFVRAFFAILVIRLVFFYHTPSLTLVYLGYLATQSIVVLMLLFPVWAIASGFNRATMPSVFCWRGRITRLKWLSIIPINLLNILLIVFAYSHSYVTWSMGALAWMVFISPWITAVSTTKRLHDINKSGWWQLLLWLIPVFGPLAAIIVLGCFKGTVGPNPFGADPKAPT